MIDLEPTSGLPLTLDDARPDLPVLLDGGLAPGTREDRKLADLRHALADGEARGPDPAYFMYRGLARFRAADEDPRRVYNWRYDVTVFPPGRYGDEYLRTLGHYHPVAEGSSVAYPEVYEVLFGEALFILQQVDDYAAGPADVRVLDLILLRATAGEKAVMLPGYGHWTVNRTDEPLVVSNWICDDFSSDYGSARAARGPSCYVVAGAGGVELRRNPSYRHPPTQVKHGRPRDVPELGLVTGKPIFRELPLCPARWRYLCDPASAGVDLQTAIDIAATEPLPG